MGQTADQLRQQVDQKRDDATQKIDQIEQQVMQGAQQVQDKFTDAAQQVKAKFDLRQQVDERPLVALGVALAGGMVLGSLMSNDDDRRPHPPGQGEHRPAGAYDGGMGGAIRNAARQSGLEDSIQSFANAAFAKIGERMREMSEQAFPGMLDKVQSAADSVSSAGRDAVTREEPRTYAEQSKGASPLSG
jgi:ElaB/YqjD/DUF883 family membrane-anchored ribosome-binding protein